MFSLPYISNQRARNFLNANDNIHRQKEQWPKNSFEEITVSEKLDKLMEIKKEQEEK
jgi:hypothetical protein